MFPKKSAFGQEDDRRRAREAQGEISGPPNPPSLPPSASWGIGGAGPGQPVEQYRQQIASLDKQSNEALYYDIDRACSLLEGPGTIPAGNIGMAREILERLRDDLYSNLR